MLKAITLLSGGLDSFISTHVASGKHRVILALTFDYGQRAARREISAAAKMCRLWKIPHKVIKLPWLAEITDTALVNRSKRIPLLCHSCESRNPLQSMDPRFRGDDRTANAVWVPNRNGVFINVAAAFAESLGAGLIIAGFNKEEAATFPDNGPSFVRAMNETLKRGTMKRPRVVSYVQNMTKVDMVKFAVSHKLPLNLCWPCYEGDKRLCGRCESCVRFLSALMLNHP